MVKEPITRSAIKTFAFRKYFMINDFIVG